MDYTIAIGLQLFDNFSKQLFAARENLERSHNSVQKTNTILGRLGETIKKAFDPKAIWEASEKMENFSLKIAQATALPLAGFTKMMDEFAEMEDARVGMEVAYMTKTGLPKKT